MFFNQALQGRLGVRARAYWIVYALIWAFYWFSDYRDYLVYDLDAGDAMLHVVAVIFVLGILSSIVEDLLSTKPIKTKIGASIGLVVFPFALYFLLHIMVIEEGHPEIIKTLFAVAPFWLFGGLGAIALFLNVVPMVFETQAYRKTFVEGSGGSARWGGTLAFTTHAWMTLKKDAPIFLGNTLKKYDPVPDGRLIGVDDENHLVTIAQSGAGKSTTVIWPNLIKYPYPDSVFVLDPKGEHATAASANRRAMGQTVIVLDPLSETQGLKTNNFNPLGEIDPNSPSAKEAIQAIAKACVIEASKTSDSGQHFTGTYQSIISGLIAHVLTVEPAQNRHLPRVYEYFLMLKSADTQEQLLNAMRNNAACGNLPTEAVLILDSAGKNERGSIITTTIQNIKWIASDGMREHLLTSDFTLSELRTKTVSLFVVLPFEAMHHSIQGRYMRVLIALAFTACRKTPLPANRSKRRTLFILDEVAQLGKVEAIEEAYRTLRGSNVKVWTFFQQYSGLSDNYDNVASITGNSTKQFFGVNDPVTAEQIEKYLGKYKHRDQTREIQRSLLDASEIQNTLGQEDLTQIVITGGGARFQLTRKPYYPKKAEVIADNGTYPRAKAHVLTPKQKQNREVAEWHEGYLDRRQTAMKLKLKDIHSLEWAIEGLDKAVELFEKSSPDQKKAALTITSQKRRVITDLPEKIFTRVTHQISAEPSQQDQAQTMADAHTENVLAAVLDIVRAPDSDDDQSLLQAIDTLRPSLAKNISIDYEPPKNVVIYQPEVQTSKRKIHAAPSPISTPEPVAQHGIPEKIAVLLDKWDLSSECTRDELDDKFMWFIGRAPSSLMDKITGEYDALTDWHTSQKSA